MSTCRCGKLTRDDAWLCEECVGTLVRLLSEMTWLCDELQVTRLRLRSPRLGATRGGANGLPWSEEAALTVNALHAMLVGWVRICEEESVHAGTLPPPADTVLAMAVWLVARVPKIALREWGPEMLREVDNLVDGALGIINNPPAWSPIGTCRDPECGARIYAPLDATVVECPACGGSHVASDLRAESLRIAEQMLMSEDEIIACCIDLGVIRSDQAAHLRRLVVRWRGAGKLRTPTDGPDGLPWHRLGDVLAMLEQRKASA